MGAAGRQIGDRAGTRAGLAPRESYDDRRADDYGAADNDDPCADNDGRYTDHDDPGTNNDPGGTDGTDRRDRRDRPVVARACEAAPARTPACDGESCSDGG